MNVNFEWLFRICIIASALYWGLIGAAYGIARILIHRATHQ